MELTALITPANSTAQIFASSDYYNRDWVDLPNGFGQPQVVPFFLGPQGIVNAIDSNYQKNPTDPIVVLASGWGAGQTGTAIGIMAANSDGALKDVKLVVLDNNTNRAGGGFWTTYSIFASPLLTSGRRRQAKPAHRSWTSPTTTTSTRTHPRTRSTCSQTQTVWSLTSTTKAARPPLRCRTRSSPRPKTKLRGPSTTTTS